MLSFWEKQSLLQYDYIIAGSGITGLSTAITLKEQAPHARVMVLEKGILPTGASTKNAGFACIGSLTELLADLKTMSPPDILEMLILRHRGLLALRQRVGDARIDYRQRGSYELIAPEHAGALQEMDRMNDLLGDVLDGDAFTLSNKNFGFNPERVSALVRNNYEGELNSGKMMRCLIDLAIEKGVEIKTGCNITAIHEDYKDVRVTVNEEINFSCRQLAICTNAFAQQLLPELDVQPGRGQVLITEVIPDLPFQGIFHMDEGYYYFRELEGRVLFGGGRNLDFTGEATHSFDLNPNIQEELENRLRHTILPGISFSIADRWTGIMAFGQNRQPIIRRHSPKIVLGVRMGGMGVAIGTEVGYRLSDLILKEK